MAGARYKTAVIKPRFWPFTVLALASTLSSLVHWDWEAGEVVAEFLEEVLAPL